MTSYHHKPFQGSSQSMNGRKKKEKKKKELGESQVSDLVNPPLVDLLKVNHVQTFRHSEKNDVICKRQKRGECVGVTDNLQDNSLIFFKMISKLVSLLLSGKEHMNK